MVNAGIGKLPIPESARRNAWKWRNIATSFVHSFVTAIWAVLCFFRHPQMAEDLIETFSVFSHALVSFSIGYFIYDFFDMVLNQKLTASWELLFHHTVVIACFGLSVISCNYVGFAVVALLVEINSVFLHLRQMLRMANIAVGTLYRVNSIINLGTYVVFRINTLAWMTRWLVLNRDKIPLLAYTLGSVGMAIMTVMNIVLFYRLLRTDFLKTSTPCRIYLNAGAQHALTDWWTPNGSHIGCRPSLRFVLKAFAMADDSGLPQQIQSVERSIVFLRQEHLTMLHGLQLEIFSLQKQCTELTTELKVKSQERTQLNLQDEEEHLELRCRDMEKWLHAQDCCIGDLRKELTHKGALVGALRANLKEKERNFLEELKRRSHCSTLLNTELQKQTEAAAYLSFQLHATRQKLNHQRMEQRQVFLASAHNQGAHYDPGQDYHSPQVPSGAFSPVVKPKWKTAKLSSRGDWTKQCVPIEKILGPAQPTAMPDPALFLNPLRHKARLMHSVAPTPPPLGLVKELDTQAGGEELEASQKEVVSSAAAPSGAETKTD
ncbi:hypothetical protein WMY93_028273 [Mugilogobius chulae]|uniref:TLC domain-containing protein n=1 Tax=Mugilogobius chulae TaxID=88201 RepID=A0AAW0MYV0_9GOBI